MKITRILPEYLSVYIVYSVHNMHRRTVIGYRCTYNILLCTCFCTPGGGMGYLEHNVVC